MRVKITMEGLPDGYVDFLINKDLPAMQKIVKNEMWEAYNHFKNDREFRMNFIKRLSSAIKKKIYPEHMREALEVFYREMKDVEIIQWIVHSRTENSVVFEIIFDDRFFAVAEALAEKRILRTFFKPLLFTKDEWLKRVEKTIKNEYKPKFYKIEVLER